MYRQSDIIVLPYRKAHFARRSSAALCDAVVFGRPIVATKDTWLGNRVQESGLGVVFADGDVEDMARAINDLLSNYSTYYERLISARDAWVAEHSPDHLVEMLRGS